MSIRFKLLLLGLFTLVLPWAGCRYAREMESALRQGEQSSLLSVAQTIASSLEGRVDLLYRQRLVQPGSDESAQTPVEATTTSPATASASAPSHETKPSPYDLRPILLPAAPFLDGYIDEWPQSKGAWKYFARGQHQFGILTGV
ncbi:MAG: hypothetical protein JO042_13480, partial [Sinobacteraceae bacterium]|nr:hypothetical protein [Nevskiaceae bacterium]